MNRVALFLVLLALTTGYALYRGGRDERLVAIILLVGVAFLFFTISPISTRYRHIEIDIMVSDWLSFVAVSAIALRSKSYWPLWMSALYFHQAISHLIPLIPGTISLAYGIIMSFWVYPMMLVLACATRRHRRRLALHHAEFTSPSY